LEKYPHFNKIIEKKFISHIDIFEFFIDFNGVMKKSYIDHLKALLHLKLKNEALLKNYDIIFNKYSELVAKNKISLFDFILDLSLEKEKIKLSIKEIFDYFPIKYPRSYSLVSNSIVDSQNLEIVFTVVKEKILRKFPQNLTLKAIKQSAYFFEGQCTNYLNNLDLDSKVILTEIKNNFTFPISKFIEESKPIIYICNGTGITPCISFLKQIKIASQRQNYNDMKNIGELKILTGFRNATGDKKETIHENFILETVNSINKKLNKDVVEYIRCLSTSEGNFLFYFKKNLDYIKLNKKIIFLFVIF
jgi:sulfite reductase alpha subunit-like flavoprotein